MNQLHAMTVAMLSIVGLAAFVPETSNETATAMEIARRADMVQGVVMMAGNSQLMIVPDAGDVTNFVVGPNARIVRDGQTTQLEALQAKDQVVVMCTGDGPERTAVDIVARSPL